MLKHRGFPGRMPGTDFQFTLRRENKKGATPLVARERYADRRPADRRADAGFLQALWEHFGEEPFERGNLDAGRLSWLFGREVVPAGHRASKSPRKSSERKSRASPLASKPRGWVPERRALWLVRRRFLRRSRSR